MLSPGDLVLVGEITDSSFKVGRVVKVTDTSIRLEPVQHPLRDDREGIYALIERDGMKIRVLPSIDALFVLRKLRGEYRESLKAAKSAMDDRVAAWIGMAGEEGGDKPC